MEGRQLTTVDDSACPIRITRGTIIWHKMFNIISAHYLKFIVPESSPSGRTCSFILFVMGLLSLPHELINVSICSLGASAQGQGRYHLLWEILPYNLFTPNLFFTQKREGPGALIKAPSLWTHLIWPCSSKSLARLREWARAGREWPGQGGACADGEGVWESRGRELRTKALPTGKPRSTCLLQEAQTDEALVLCQTHLESPWGASTRTQIDVHSGHLGDGRLFHTCVHQVLTKKTGQCNKHTL